MKLNSGLVNIGLLDLEGSFDILKKGLENEGSFQITPKLEFRPDEGSPVFKPNFIKIPNPLSTDQSADPNPKEHILFTMFIIPANPDFVEKDFDTINQWKKENPDKPFMTIILSKPPTAWVALTTSRSKLEKRFNKSVTDSTVVVIKYNVNETNKSNYINISDFQYLHTAIEGMLTTIIESRINTLLHTHLNDDNYIPVYAELSSHLISLGYNSASFTFASKIKSAPYSTFWPRKPEFYDIQKEIIEKYDTGYDIVCSGLSQTFACGKKSKSLYPKLADELTVGFAIILSHCGQYDSNENETVNLSLQGKLVESMNSSQLFFQDISPKDDMFMVFFARNLIHYTASAFCDLIDTTNELISATFSLIALSQTIFIFKLQSELNQKDEFLSNLPQSRNDKLNCEQLLLASWGRARKVFTDMPNHQKYFDSLFFNYLTVKDDKDGALQMFNDSESLKQKHTNFFNYFESHVLLQLFEWKKADQNLAMNIITSKVPKHIKREALESIPKVHPPIPIGAKIICPKFFMPIDLFDKAPFRIVFHAPDFLIPNGNEKIGKSVIYVIFKNTTEKKRLKSDPVEAEFTSESFILNTFVDCLFSGIYDKMILCIDNNGSSLRWNLNVLQKLYVKEVVFVPEITLKCPYLISQIGTEMQKAVVTVNNLDIECSEVGFSFNFEKTDESSTELMENDDKGIYKIECNNVVYEGEQLNNDIILKTFPTKLDFNIFLKYERFYGLTVTCRYNQRDGQTKMITSAFEFPSKRIPDIWIYQQNESVQQFEIKNPFPTDFSFAIDEKVHQIKEKSSFFIMRPRSENSLSILFREKNWEDFPVRISTAQFQLNHQKCDMKINQINWEVGEPRVVEINPSGIPIIDEDDPDWIVSTSDLQNRVHIFIPKRPGILPFPQFLINNQAMDASIAETEIVSSNFPTYVPI